MDDTICTVAVADASYMVLMTMANLSTNGVDVTHILCLRHP